MCGFVGFTGVCDPEKKKQLLKPMLDRIMHRGPDMGNVYSDAVVGLGFRRLSIIDLSAEGNQPMQNEDGTVYVVFNGEIYNFMQLRHELEEKGHIFSCNSDTEVLLHGWEEWGENLVQRLRGMYAFAVWDKNTETLFAARDPFGIKPFYYYHLPNGNVLFGSEIKSFLDFPSFKKEVNPRSLRPYLGFQYDTGAETFFKGVFCLPQGHYAVWTKDAPLRIECFWDAEFSIDETMSFDDCVSKIDTAVHESVEAHRISDVKVGSFLSGGVDSSYITACLMPEKTFSVGFANEEFDETGYAVELSEKLGVSNSRKHLTSDECFDAFPDIVYHLDLPQSNPSLVPLWFLAELASEHVTVVLSGEGADELFAGYELYADTTAVNKFKKVPLAIRRMLAGLAKKLPDFKGKNSLLRSAERPKDWFIGQAGVFSDQEALDVLRPAYQEGLTPLEITAPYYQKVQDKEPVTQMQSLDMHLWLPGDILLKADKMCMAHSLELRVPFLDKEIFGLSSTIPSKHLIQGTNSKMAFRTAANKVLPDEWATRPKKGFPVPIRLWLREKKHYETVRAYFESAWAAEFFETEKIVALLQDHYEERANNGRKIWTIFTFLSWYKRFFIDEESQAQVEEDL